MAKVFILSIHTDFEDCSEVLGASRTAMEPLERLAEVDCLKRLQLEDWLPITWTKQETKGSLFTHEQWRGEMARTCSQYYTIDEVESLDG